MSSRMSSNNPLAPPKNTPSDEGAQSARWSYVRDADVLMLNQDMGAGSLCLPLSHAQTQRLQALGATTECLKFTICSPSLIELVLVGKKTSVGLWGGLVNRADDVDGIINSLQKALSFSEQIVSEVNSLVVVIDRNYKVRRFNRVCEEGSGMKEADMIGIDAHSLFLPASHQLAAKANIADFFREGESFETVRPVNSPLGQRMVHWRNKLVRGGSDEDTYLVCSGIDITEDLANRQRLHEQATQDHETGLPNGLASHQLLEAAIQLDRPITLISLVVLNYRSLRGMLGMSNCENLMKQVVSAIVRATPPEWVVSRPGLPELRLHIEAARTDEEMLAISDELNRAFSQTFLVAGAQVRLHVAIGGARFPEHAASVDELEMAADAAMHAAMTRAGNRFELYASSMRDELAESLWLDAQLHEALEKDQLELWYQPKVNLADGTTNSVEALIRWKHPEIGYVMPDRFIPRAEATGMIVQIGRWVTRAAALQAKAWADDGRPLRISVNVSAKQITHDPSMSHVLKSAQDYCGGLIDVELTESCLLEDAQAARAFIEHCRSLGCGIHLDDFGSGYSSLGQLAGLDLSAVKLDRTFIADQKDSPKQLALLIAISHLAQALGLDVIAEGVETEEMVLKLGSIGVQYAQGWRYSKAVPSDTLMSWLDGR